MQNVSKIILIMLGLISISFGATAQSRQRLSMDLNWKFKLGDHQRAKNITFNDQEWRTLDLPHDWSIEGQFDKKAPGGGNIGYLPTGIGWYRKHFSVPKKVLSRKVWIQFDGVYMNADVWINGYHLGNHPYGYTSFFYDVSPFLKSGQNVIAVRVDNSKQPNSRWYSGSGIYRHVWMTVTNPLHIDHWGEYVTTPVANRDSALVKVETKIKNDQKKARKGTLVAVLMDSTGKEVARTQSYFSVDGGTVTTVSQQLHVTNPYLWSIEKPSMYSLRTIIQRGNHEVDKVKTPVGIRRIRYFTDKGFYLNGKHVKMHGVNLHHAAGAVGAAVPEGVWVRRLKLLKGMGINAIRTSHNPPAPEFLALCDRLGMLVMEEAFDEWEAPKRKYAYHNYFDDWSERDLTSMLTRDRNHPSVVLWSVGNEIGEQTTPNGTQVLKKLVDTTHRLDPTRPVTTGNDHIADDQHPTQKSFLETEDIVGYNYADRWHERRELYYTPDKLKHPDWKMIGTESPNIYGVRGDYSLGDSSIVQPNYNFNMIRVEQLWKFVATHDYVIGDFMWTGIDYLGESFWPHKNASSGSLDLAGFKKDSYYFYQSQWTDKPVLHLFPDWNWPKKREGQIIPVLAYTNCDTVDLYLNGKFMGEQRMVFPRQGTSGGWNSYDHPRVSPTTADLHLSWDVPYEPGMVTAVGRKKGKTITDTLQTTGKPSAIRLKIDHSTIRANNRDVVHVKCEIVDDEDRVNSVANNELHFHISGPGRLIGIGSGNPEDHESHKGSNHQAFHGLALGIVQTTCKAGDITVSVTAKGLKGASVEVISHPGKNHSFYWSDVYSAQ